jgi:hypothetical protein
MGQVFHRSANTIARVSILGAAFVIAAFICFLLTFVQSPYVTQAGVVRPQPVPFSHKHHVQDVGIDCRYCHTSVEDSAFAGIPPVEICMQCHTQIWKDSPVLEPVRESYQSGKPLVWTRVNNLPGYSYFDHSIHIAKGVACVTCHGQVDEMPLTWQDKSLLMGWCINCHKDPAPNLRPRDQVFNMEWTPPDDIQALQQKLLVEYHVQSKLSCSTCHR